MKEYVDITYPKDENKLTKIEFQQGPRWERGRGLPQQKKWE